MLQIYLSIYFFSYLEKKKKQIQLLSLLLDVRFLCYV